MVQLENLAIPFFMGNEMASISRRGIYWRAQVRIKGQQPISRTFDTKGAAEKWARQTESEMDRGIFYDRTEAEKTTLVEALVRYEKEVIVRKNYPCLLYTSPSPRD